MSIPAPDTPAPSTVRRLAGGAGMTAVWRNGLGGLTFRTDDGRFIKWGPRNLETTLAAEAERLRWAIGFTPVPRVIELGADATHEWMVTAPIDGESAVAPRWIEDAATAVRAVGRGLRELHEALPVDECPFEWSVASRTANAAARGIRVPEDLRVPPPIERSVVCHGDACAPNTLLGADGGWVAHVDLGSLGVADRWADIAVAAMSTEWNYGPGWADTLIRGYGIDPAGPEYDRGRLAYYRALWNAT